MPPSTAKIIINPYSGRWKARDNLSAVETAFQRASIPYELAITQTPADSRELARSSVLAGYHPIVAVGGDSTVGEVVNGLVAAAGDKPTMPLGIIPLGTANDLAYGLNIPQEVDRAVRIIAQGQTRLIDLGRVNGRFFGNNAAIGLEPTITLTSTRLVRIKGTIRYLVAALIGIVRRPAWEMQLEWDQGSYQGPVLLVSVGNGQRTGGSFFMTPRAEFDDGQLDFVFGPSMSRLRLLQILPSTFNGSLLEQPNVHYGRTTKLCVTSRPGTPIHADGEVFELNAEEIVFEVIPRRLTVLVDNA